MSEQMQYGGEKLELEELRKLHHDLVFTIGWCAGESLQEALKRWRAALAERAVPRAELRESQVEDAFREWWDARDTATKLRSPAEMTAYQRIRTAFYAGAALAAAQPGEPSQAYKDALMEGCSEVLKTVMEAMADQEGGIGIDQVYALIDGRIGHFIATVQPKQLSAFEIVAALDAWSNPRRPVGTATRAKFIADWLNDWLAARSAQRQAPPSEQEKKS